NRPRLTETDSRQRLLCVGAARGRDASILPPHIRVRSIMNTNSGRWRVRRIAPLVAVVLLIKEAAAGNPGMMARHGSPVIALVHIAYRRRHVAQLLHHVVTDRGHSHDHADDGHGGYQNQLRRDNKPSLVIQKTPKHTSHARTPLVNRGIRNTPDTHPNAVGLPTKTAPRRGLLARCTHPAT